MTRDPLEREKLFQRWWKASKYCQVIYPEPHLEQYARDGFAAGLEAAARLAALTSDTHNHCEDDEFGESATVRRSPVVTDEMVERAMKSWFGDDYQNGTVMGVAATMDIHGAMRDALTAALEYKP